MRRALAAWREWMELRTRVREEYRFHLDRAAEELECFGLSPRDARRRARARLGRGRNYRDAMKEIGGGSAGLLALMRAHRVMSSVWLQPISLLSVIALMMLLSPAPRLLVESVIGTPVGSADVQTVYLSVPQPWPLFTGITEREFEKLQSLETLGPVERYRGVYARGASRGFSIREVENEVRAKTGNRDVRAATWFDDQRVDTSPALVVWILATMVIIFPLRERLFVRGNRRWLLYAVGMGCLHLIASLTIWGVGVQRWQAFGSLFAPYMLLVAWQCRCLLRDLEQRCPVCLDRVLLGACEGEVNRVLVEAPVTESICAHGHGVLIESRWQREFRPSALLQI